MTTSIPEMVAKGKNVNFVRFDGFTQSLWYKTDTGFEFPVPLKDTEGAIFVAQDKAILFMRWIRPHFALVQKAKLEELMLPK